MDLGSSHLSTTFWSSELKYGDSDLLRVGGYVWAVLYRHTPDDEKSYVWTKMHYNVILESIWILPKNLINMVTRKLNFTLPEERETRGTHQSMSCKSSSPQGREEGVLLADLS